MDRRKCKRAVDERTPAFVKQVYEIAEAFVPEYDVKKIVDQLSGRPMV